MEIRNNSRAFLLNKNKEIQKNTFHGLKWWSLEELKTTTEEFEPRDGILNILNSPVPPVKRKRNKNICSLLSQNNGLQA